MRVATAGALAVWLVAAGGCGGPEAGGGGGAGSASSQASDGNIEPAAPFTEEAAAAGLDFVHRNGMAGDYHMAELMGSGAALFDYDGDGDLDLYVVQSGELPAGAGPRPPPGSSGDRLYRNDTQATGPIRFTDVTTSAGDLGSGYGMGVAAGDYDGDGRVDLYVTNFGPDQLLHNEGDGTFRDVTAEAGVDAAGTDTRWSVPATFFDFDRDGRLDLFVGHYLVYGSAADHRPCADPAGHRDYCGAVQFPGDQDRLLRNTGDGTFEDATAPAGLGGHAGRALGAVAADFDGDGWPDLYVGNDAGPNFLWINRRDGTFEERALLAGAAVNADGKAEASMGVDAADPDGDGDFDLFLTHLVVETNTFYRNLGAGLFEDATAATGLGPPSRVHTGFGTAFLDYDGDGRLDLLVANGAVQNIASLVAAGDPFPFHETNQLFRNVEWAAGEGSAGGPGSRGGGGSGPRYEETTATAGPDFGLSESSRGAAFGDLDGDGDTDVVIVNNRGPARLLVNQADRRRGRERSWIGLRLTTGSPPRDALGARVDLRLAGRPPRRDRVAADGSYASANDPRLLFALGAGDEVAGVEVRWPDGSEEGFPAPEAGRYTTLAQGGGRAMTAAGRGGSEP